MAEEAKSQRPDTNIEMETDYANNIFLEPSVWDLKLIFGEFSGRTNAVDWHTSITIPWAQAKLLMFYLGMNIAIRELNQGGPIQLPATMVPSEPPAPEEGGNELNEAIYKFAREYHQRFMASLNKTPSV